MANPQTDPNINHNQNVSRIQKYLREISYIDKRIPMTSIDGVYTPQLTETVAAFQKFYGLPVTGEVDKATWDKIYEEYFEAVKRKQLPQCIFAFPSPSTILKPGDSGDAVYFLQVMLSALGKHFYNIPKVEINGIYDDKTHTAVTYLKSITRTDSEGVDKQIWDAITRTYNTLD